MNRTQAYAVILEMAETHKHQLRGNARRTADAALKRFRSLVTRMQRRADHLKQQRAAHATANASRPPCLRH